MRRDDVGVSIMISDVSDPNLKLEQQNYWTFGLTSLVPAQRKKHMLTLLTVNIVNKWNFAKPGSKFAQAKLVTHIRPLTVTVDGEFCW